MEGDWVVLKEVDRVVSEMVGLEVLKDFRNPCARLGPGEDAELFHSERRLFTGLVRAARMDW